MQRHRNIFKKKKEEENGVFDSANSVRWIQLWSKVLGVGFNKTKRKEIKAKYCYSKSILRMMEKHKMQHNV